MAGEPAGAVDPGDVWSDALLALAPGGKCSLLATARQHLARVPDEAVIKVEGLRPQEADTGRQF